MNTTGIELSHLHYFVTVAEELHFSRAAIKLGLSQPPLTQQIQKLEQRIGFPLFERSTRRTTLTDAGAALLPLARAAIVEVDRAIEAARRAGRGESGALVVATPPSLMLSTLPKVIRTFRQRLPQIELHLREMSTTAIAEALSAGTVDIGFLRTPSVSSSLRELLRYREATAAILPATHPLAKTKRLRLSQLAAEPFVFFPRQLGADFYDELLAACREEGFEPRIVQQATQWSTIVSLVEAGLGVSLAPQSIARLASRNCVFRPFPKYSTTVIVACPAQRLTPQADHFLKLVTAVTP